MRVPRVRFTVRQMIVGVAMSAVEFLIGPDGKLIAKDLRYKDIGKAVGAALAR
jgi:hypothetical protein